MLLGCPSFLRDLQKGWGCLSLASPSFQTFQCATFQRWFSPISFPVIHLRIYLDKDGTDVVTSSLIVSHQLDRSFLHLTFTPSDHSSSYLLSFDILAHSFSQRRISILRVFSLLRTLSIATGVYTPISPNRGT